MPLEPDSVPHDSALDAALERQPGVLAFLVNRHLVHHLLRTGRTLDNDYQALVLWSVLLQHGGATLIDPAGMPLVALEGGHLPAAETHKRALRASDLSQITGFPRETVRRKLDKLRRAGRVARDASQRWYGLSLQDDPAERELTRDTVRHYLHTADLLRNAIRRAAE